MIVKAINQDEFRDFSFVNPDWRPHTYRPNDNNNNINTVGESSSNYQQQASSGSYNYNINVNNILPSSASTATSPSPRASSPTLQEMSLPSIAVNTTTSHTSNSGDSSSPYSATLSPNTHQQQQSSFDSSMAKGNSRIIQNTHI